LFEHRPFFSIIIPTYNRAEKLRRALKSLETQSFRDFEVLVCDDGSTDDTGLVVESFADKLPLRYLHEENWGGPARPRNNGLKAADGEWICFLDADDWWYQGKLAEVASRIEDADVICHDCDVYSEAGKRPVKKRGRHFDSPAFAELMTNGNAIITSSVCVRKNVLEKTDRFLEDKSLIAIEDYELWLRLSRLTDRFLYIPQSLGAYWVDGENISEYTEKYVAREIAVNRKYIDYLCPADRLESELLLSYKIGIAKKCLGLFDESKGYFLKAMRSRRLKIKTYALIYYILACCHSRCTIP